MPNRKLQFLGAFAFVVISFWCWQNLGTGRVLSAFRFFEIKNTPWSLMITGDVIPARVVNQKMVAKKDFFWPLVNIAGVLQNADLTLINLEAPLFNNCPVTNEGFKFCGEDDFSQSLATSGVDVTNLANNHTLNYGWEGLKQTQEVLTSVGIGTTGFTASLNNNCQKSTMCSSFLIEEVKGLKLGFLGYNAVGQKVNRQVAESEIRAAKTQVDLLIVSVHWGKEYVREPQIDRGLAPDDPKELGRLFVDWGADIVAGNHPHWWQPAEFYKGKLIIYALGNTIFDQEWSQETKRGILLKLYFTGTTLVKNKTEVTPIGIRDYGQAYLLEGKEKTEIANFYQSLFTDK